MTCKDVASSKKCQMINYLKILNSEYPELLCLNGFQLLLKSLRCRQKRNVNLSKCMRSQI